MTDENLIYVLGKRLALYQAPEGFRTSMDSVMLAAACPANKDDNILDLGCGVGSAGFCVLTRLGDTRLTGIDIQDDHVALAVKNAQTNGMEERAQFLQGNVKDLELEERFDHVIFNPPYKESGAHISSPSVSKAKAIGHTENEVDLKTWISCAHRHIRGQGSLTIIHEASQLDTLIHSLFGREGGRRFGNIEIIPLYPKVGKAAKRVIVRAYKHKKSKSILHAGLILHNENGNYTKEADHVLREAASLFL